ncbi:MAG: 23S rRNA pseudouridine(1911/1915/1917) synthase RluD [Gammaproteobacteria bacterium]|nr:23S rRNA pseudouridine(1911/1915/1917) synthase RluD [Gammaproteobacteria bacterium]
MSIITEKYQNAFELSSEDIGSRLDQAISNHCQGISRSKLQAWIKAGSVTVDGKIETKPKAKMLGTESIEVSAELEQAGEWEAQNIPLDVVFEDDNLLIVNKPAGLVVHPAVGNRNGTLVNALLYRAPELIKLPRAGIVHRLDKDTSGLLVVAKNLESHNSLVAQLQERAFEREYQCVVHGQMVAGGSAEQPIGRHPTNRIQMAVVPNGKEALTHFRLIEKFNHFTHLKVNLETGRTHQIRVHMAYLKYPLVGDPLYGKKNFAPSGSSEELRDALRHFKRQALHARKLGLIHPTTNEFMSWEQSAPDDYLALVDTLKKYDPLS